ncbi:LIM domain only protein 7-like isoform X1 [Corythoichthys intestinalis]|uniref:LIM domain only protein 7-like isoform X1 n=1 Tax=Corythoichthys intestinalis TaxID=161448 RepID=UPI0025A644FC|nr:LIM domain only protein 7-like isoform X1 [Corythoichthys intestinalis]
MEWREQSTVSCQDAYVEAQRWIEAVTKKTFKGKDFRSALENGVLLCDLINKIRPGIIKRVNRLPTPIAGLDNINVFLKACLKLGLKEAQLFHPGDLQDLSSRVTVNDEETDRRLKNVLITLYWLSRRAQGEHSYDGPYLNFKAFEGLLGTALHKALQELSGQKGKSIQDSGLGDSWYSEREELHDLRGQRGGHRRDDSLDSLDSLSSQPLSISSDVTLKGSSEGCCSDAEADAAFKMAHNKESLSYRRSVTLTPKVTTQFNQFLPSKDKTNAYVPAPLRKKRAERNDDNRRSWANPSYEEEDIPIVRQRQASESFDGSKSTSDITDEPTLVRRRSQYEALEKYREQVKQSDDKWQDDLSKWKNRRKSVNSDIVKKKEEREEIEKITNTGSTRRSKTYQEMQEDREFRRSNSIGSRIGSLSFDNDSDVFEKPKPRSRDSLSRSYTVDTFYHSSGSSEAAGKVDNPPDAPLTSTKQKTHAPGDTNTRTQPAESTFSLRSSFLESTAKTEKISPTLRTSQKVPEPNSPAKAQPPSSASMYRPTPPIKTEASAAAVSRISASLPRSYQRSDSARLSSVVTPRPFGTQPSHVGSLTRTVTSMDSSSRINGNTDFSKNPLVPSRYHQFMTPEDEAQSQSSPANSSEDDDEQEETEGKSLTSTSSISSVQVKKEFPVKEPGKESSCEMRISLNQKPNSGRDFGFDVAWDSSGAHVKSIQPGSPAEMFQLQTGDEVLTVNGQRVTDMRYLDWKDSLDRALQEGSLVMDIRRHGKSNWDRDPSSPPYKGHKTINLTSTAHPILVGFPDTSATNTLDFTSIADDPAKGATRSIVDVASNGVDGGFPKVSMTTKESEPISMINLKRRSEFFEKGGTDSTLPDIPVPPITASSTRWAWDPEEERKRQEKWQKEQERQLQEKYKRDQEKLQEEWTKAQQEISSSVEPVGPTLAYRELEQERERLEEERRIREEKEEQERMKLELERKLREEEFERHRQEMRRREEELERERQEVERKRREQEQELERQREEMRRREEELERQRQQEEERKKREAELERLKMEEEEKRRREAEEEEERRRRREKEEEERRQREEEELLWQRRREAEKEELRRRMVAVEEQQRRERERAVDEQRAKTLEDEERLQSRVTSSDVVDAAAQQPISQAELQRQQLLSDMKKKNNLLTDNSWIRRGAANTPGREEPPSTRRGGSFEHLDNPSNSWRSSWTPKSDSFFPNYSRPHSALSGSASFYGGGATGARSGSSTLPASFRGPAAGTTPWSRQSLSPSPSSISPTISPEPGSDAGGQQQHSRSVSGKKVCTFCDTALGKGAAMIIESLGLCYHLTCFKCIDCKSALGGSEAGAEVRIRNKQLYCNTCYKRFKDGQPTTM